MSIAIVGVVLLVLGVLSRFFALPIFKLVSASPTREVRPSSLPATPWFRVESDRKALDVIVRLTYAAVLLGMLLVLFGVLV